MVDQFRTVVQGSGPATAVDSGPVDPAVLRSWASSGIEELVLTTRLLRRQLGVHEDVCRKVVAGLDQGAPMACLLDDVEAASWRGAVTEAVKGFEVTRHRVRLLLVAIAVDEGMSITDVARHWGVSRQLASRWVQESADLAG